MKRCRALRAPRARRLTLALAALLAFGAAVGAGGCSSDTATPTTPYTAVPIGPTGWPNGTVGQYGLHIDPSLLARLPQFVGAEPVTEDPLAEQLAMDQADMQKTFDAYAAAKVGDLGNTDWLKIVMGRFVAGSSTPDMLQSWQASYAQIGCSQADGVASNSQQTIKDWLVDVSVCSGGPTVYTLSLGSGVVVSILGFGPKDLGRRLIEALY